MESELQRETKYVFKTHESPFGRGPHHLKYGTQFAFFIMIICGAENEIQHPPSLFMAFLIHLTGFSCTSTRAEIFTWLYGQKDKDSEINPDEIM